MDRPDSVALLRKAKAGAPDALEALYAQVAGKLLSLIRLRMGRSLRARLESRDILRATFLKSFEHLSQLEHSDSASFMAWLVRIAENEIRDQTDRLVRQRRDARVEVPLDAGADEVAARVRSALSRVILSEESERLERTLEALSEPHREIAAAATQLLLCRCHQYGLGALRHREAKHLVRQGHMGDRAGGLRAARADDRVRRGSVETLQAARLNRGNDDATC